MIPLNILDYSLIDEGETAIEALQDTVSLAKLAERLNFHRFWVPEQHHAFSIASSSPEMLMMYLATQTKRIRIGSGGVMLPHYSPYKVAENFRTLEAFHPNRIDLGIGNSPGGRLVQRALNEGKSKRLTYEEQTEDVLHFLKDDSLKEHRFGKLRATPIIKTTPEIWMLGAGGSSTKIAAENGTAFTYAHFIKPVDKGREVIASYREHFKASPFHASPLVSIAVFAIIAETTEEAEELALAFDYWMLSLETAKNPTYFPSVHTAKQQTYSAFERKKISNTRKKAIIGDPEKVKAEILQLAEFYHADEVTIIPNFPGTANRMKGIELLAEAFGMK
ncbi:LLM class flavin-dependent oxidoreductase [Oceanobacillus piezotolerans]|uniref:LLM class flavin-dependent oxidoreductase n=1 Tax=Oceanobacillus piezotolerans TaxID=2448030 RepID=A0A498DDJ7_9BACI|nr:LLM class flavin-dependent oxidoreductase [Oceanobacillus piezotolerans]RLL47037.1 LLM class flavin-dependent oxidoreductase [Oceanobacillus piezotolerans]